MTYRSDELAAESRLAALRADVARLRADPRNAARLRARVDAARADLRDAERRLRRLEHPLGVLLPLRPLELFGALVVSGVIAVSLVSVGLFVLRLLATITP